MGQAVDLAGPDLEDAAALAGQMGVRSMRLVQQALDHWRRQCVILRTFYNGFGVPDGEDPFPNLSIVPDFKDCTATFLNTKKIGFSDLIGKVAYSLCVKVLNKTKLNGRTDSPWRAHFGVKEDVRPEWRALYQPPLVKKIADLQWRHLHGIVAVNSYLDFKSQCF